MEEKHTPVSCPPPSSSPPPRNESQSMSPTTKMPASERRVARRVYIKNARRERGRRGHERREALTKVLTAVRADANSVRFGCLCEVRLSEEQRKTRVLARALARALAMVASGRKEAVLLWAGPKSTCHQRKAKLANTPTNKVKKKGRVLEFALVGKDTK